MDRLHTCYAPVRRSPSKVASYFHAAPRLACVRPVASVHPEPGSNSSLYIYFFCFYSDLGYLFLVFNKENWRLLFFSLTLFWLYIVQSIKELFAFHCLNNTTAIRFSQRPFVIETDCKDMSTFWIYQIFWEKFSKYFSESLDLIFLKLSKLLLCWPLLVEKRVQRYRVWQYNPNILTTFFH